MRTTTVLLTILLAALVLPTAATAQEYSRPARVDATFKTLIGEWEGMMTLTWTGGAVQKIPITCRCTPVLDTTSVSCMITMVFTSDYSIHVMQLFSWDAMTKKFVMFETADNGEVSYSEGLLPSVPSDPWHLKMLPKILENVEHAATTDFSTHGNNELRYLVDYRKDGKSEINQVVKLTRK